MVICNNSIQIYFSKKKIRNGDKNWSLKIGLSFFATTDENIDQNYDENSCSNTNEDEKQLQFADSRVVVFFESFFKISSGNILGFVIHAILFPAILDLLIDVGCIIWFASEIFQIYKLGKFHLFKLKTWKNSLLTILKWMFLS